jgi:hypothetical protein
LAPSQEAAAEVLCKIDMYLLALFVIVVLLSAVYTRPIYVSECGILTTPRSTYTFAHDIVVQNTSYGYVCFDITGDEITLDGNGFELLSASNELTHTTGVQFSGGNVVITNIRIKNMRTGIRANGKFGDIYNNTITQAINGIDVSAMHNNVQNNIIRKFEAYESTAGIYVYFPAIVPVDSYINITNNVISDIQADSFALGISVYYATSVFISHNFIFDLRGGISSEAISVIHGEIDAVNNSFNPPTTKDLYSYVITVSASLFALLATFVFFQSSSLSLSSRTFAPIECAGEEEIEEKSETSEEEEFEKDGADVVMPISLSRKPLPSEQ